MAKRKQQPDIRSGGVAIPVDKNTFLLSGNTHEEGGIDIGDDIEAEDKEVVQMTDEEMRIFSAQPILNGSSPAEKVLGGASKTKVLKAQEKYKKDHKLNDDGTKARYGKRRKYAFGSDFTWEDGASLAANIGGSVGSYITSNIANSNTENRLDDEKDYITALGELNTSRINALEYADAPTAVQAAKLITDVNVNSQLNSVKDSLDEELDSIDKNTSSSKTASVRKAKARSTALKQLNEIYAYEQNAEAQLINEDAKNSQAVRQQNAADYNAWAKGNAEFNASKTNVLLSANDSTYRSLSSLNNKYDNLDSLKSQNTSGMIQQIVNSGQDVLDSKNTKESELMTLAAEIAKGDGASLESIQDAYDKLKDLDLNSKSKSSKKAAKVDSKEYEEYIKTGGELSEEEWLRNKYKS